MSERIDVQETRSCKETGSENINVPEYVRELRELWARPGTPALFQKIVDSGRLPEDMIKEVKEIVGVE